MIGREVTLGYAKASPSAAAPGMPGMPPVMQVQRVETRYRIVGIVERETGPGIGGSMVSGLMIPLPRAREINDQVMAAQRSVMRGRGAGDGTFQTATVKVGAPQRTQDVQERIKKLGFTAFPLNDALEALRLFVQDDARQRRPRDRRYRSLLVQRQLACRVTAQPVLVIGAHAAAQALQVMGADGLIRTMVVRDERPFHVITEAHFFRADRALERLLHLAGTKAAVSLERDAERSVLRIRFDFTREPEQREGPVVRMLEDIDDLRFVLTEGRFVAGGGFDVPDRTRAVVSREWLAAAEKALASRRAIELALTWEVGERQD